MYNICVSILYIDIYLCVYMHVYVFFYFLNIWAGHGSILLFFILYLTDIFLMPYSTLCTKSENEGDLRGVGFAVRKKEH